LHVLAGAGRLERSFVAGIPDPGRRWGEATRHGPPCAGRDRVAGLPGQGGPGRAGFQGSGRGVTVQGLQRGGPSSESSTLLQQARLANGGQRLAGGSSRAEQSAQQPNHACLDWDRLCQQSNFPTTGPQGDPRAIRLPLDLNFQPTPSPSASPQQPFCLAVAAALSAVSTPSCLPIHIAFAQAIHHRPPTMREIISLNGTSPPRTRPLAPRCPVVVVVPLPDCRSPPHRRPPPHPPASPAAHCCPPS